MKRVLFVSYTFPPVGGAGVQRTAKFAKYLPGCGWDVSVLTAANPSVPLLDDSQCAEIPAATVIERAPTWEPSYKLKSCIAVTGKPTKRNSLRSSIKAVVRSAANLVLQPDPQILWAPQAMACGRHLLQRLPHDVIVATGPPFSSFIVGRRLSRKFNIPLVLDYRDEWDISNEHWENRRLLAVGQRFQSWLQDRLLRSAHTALATTKLSAQRIQRRVAQAGAKVRVQHVYNGYDPDDFSPQRSPARPNRRCRILYAGTLWKLTSIEPLVQAAELIHATEPEIAKRLELVIAGRRTDEQNAILDRLSTTHVALVRSDYVPHHQAVQLMHDSDYLCVLLSDTPDAGRVVPAKLFEYMACKRPVLAIAPPGEMWELLQGHPDARLFTPSDTEAIAEALVNAVRHLHDRRSVASDWDVSCYSRPSQAKQLAEILDSATSASGSCTRSVVQRPAAG